MKTILPLTALSITLATACSVYTPPRYTISADNNVALRATGGSNINVGSFRSLVALDTSCRGAASISPPDGMTFEAYIQKALTDELKIAGMFDDRSPRITLTGTVEQLSFSSTRAVTGGTWDIGLRVFSSNGKSTFVAEHYEFESGYDGAAACRQTAEAWLPAVQDLLGRLLRSPAFRDMITP